MKTVPDHETLFVEPGFEEHLKDGEEWLKDYLVVQSIQGLETVRQYLLPCLDQYDEEFSDMISQAGPGLSFDVDDLSVPFDHPALILTSRQDSVVGFQDAWSLLEIFPRATYAVLDRAGHFVGLVEQTDLFRSVVGDWLNRLAQESSFA
jgi:pimeloyl-ACP methyl ester carboxylesterase